LWEFRFVPFFVPEGTVSFGGGDVINKDTGELLQISSAYLDINRTDNPKPVSVPRFSIEGLDYYDEKTDTFKLKPGAPHWAKQEFEAFYGTDEFEQEYLPQSAQVAYA
jgi:hypothetical protein